MTLTTSTASQKLLIWTPRATAVAWTRPVCPSSQCKKFPTQSLRLWCRQLLRKRDLRLPWRHPSPKCPLWTTVTSMTISERSCKELTSQEGPKKWRSHLRPNLLTARLMCLRKRPKRWLMDVTKPSTLKEHSSLTMPMSSSRWKATYAFFELIMQRSYFESWEPWISNQLAISVLYFARNYRFVLA